MNTNSLNTADANHLTLKGKHLDFEILGGINSENVQSLRVMLITKCKRATHRNNIDLYNQDQLQAYKNKVVEITGVHRDATSLDFEHLITQLEEYKLELRHRPTKPAKKAIQLSDEQRDEAIQILKQSDLLNIINELIGKTGIVGNETNRMILFLTYLTRRTRNGLHAVIHSKFNSLQSKMAEVIPDEEKFTISHISENALFYFDEEELQNKVVLVEDTISNRKSLMPLIGFQKSNVITKTTVTKNEYAELVTVQKHVKGNVALSISTREEHAFTKHGLLSFVLSEDSGSIQDEKVLLYQRMQSAGHVSEFTEKKIAQQIQNIQRALEPVTVINPYAMEVELPEQIRNKQITNLHYLRFIEIITFLKQYQREKKVNEDTGEIYIETSIEDIKEANELLAEVLLNRSDKITKTSRIYLEQLKSFIAASKSSGESFTLLEVSIALQVPKTTLKRYLKVWVDFGLVRAIQCKGQAHQFELVDVNEYKELQVSISKTLESNVRSIQSIHKKLNDKSETRSNQNKNGAVKRLENRKLVNVKPNK